MEERVVIQDFPKYEVSNLGKVYKIGTGRELTLSVVTGGALSVGLMHEGFQYRRQVKTLVARAFVEGEDDVSDTPVLLDGNRSNLCAWNIVWRPRWFSWKYLYQLYEYERWAVTAAIVDDQGYVYTSFLDAAMSNGILCYDIFRSIHEGKPVYPTEQIFRYI